MAFFVIPIFQIIIGIFVSNLKLMMDNTTDRYAGRGVSSGKEEVHAAIKDMDKGLFPLAFCKILPDWVGNDEQYCNIIHADTAGTKPSLAYMYWKETGDISVWESIAQDALVMNLDDMACVGVLNEIILSSTIGRNKHQISGDVIAALIGGTQRFIAAMREYGIHIKHGGGETADVGDIVRTIDVGFTMFARMKKDNLVVNAIKGGQYIVGLAGYGQASWETEYNSGIASNGLTSARHDVLSNVYAAKYPESYDQSIPKDLVYSGSKLLTDTLDIGGRPYPIGKLLLSPTRTFLPLLKQILDTHRPSIKGMIHNTGGAHSKVLKYCESVKIVKNNLLEVPPIFKMIQEESGASLQEMYKVFNMGTRLEIYVDTLEAANALVALSESMQVAAQVIGYTEDAASPVSELHIGDSVITYA